MTKKPKKPAPAGRSPGRRVAAVVLVLLTAGGVVLAVRFAGDAALGRLAGRDRYRARVADVVCDAPPGLDRPTFLNEVRYVGDLPEAVGSLDPADLDRLAKAFAAHPWVAAVREVSAQPGSVRAQLTFREPLLAVKMTDGPPRLVDAAGVLLPVADATGLPLLVAGAKPPGTAAGKVWDDPAVRRAIELVEAYHPAQLQPTVGGWRLTMPDGQVLAVPR